MRVHMMENMSRVIQFLSKKVALENIGSEDLVDGNAKLTLGLIWTVILRFQIQDISVEALSAKEALLLWCQRKTHGYPNVNVQNFSNSWSNGLAFMALIHKHRPDLVNFDALDKNDNVGNLTKAFDICEKEFGIAKLLDVEDVNVDRPDERSVMTYVAALYHYFNTAKQEGVAAGRLGHVVDFMAEIEAMQEQYEKMVTDLLAWIAAKRAILDSREFPPTVPELQTRMDSFKTYLTGEKPPKYSEKSNLEVQLFDIQTKLRSRSRPMYQPPVGKSVHDVNKAWKKLERSEHEHDLALHEELIRQERLEQLAQRFNRKAEIRDAWLDETDRQLVSIQEQVTRAVAEKDLHTVDGVVKRLDALESDVRAQEDRVDSLTDLAEELDEGKYHGREAIMKRDADIEAKFTNTDKSLRARRKAVDSAQLVCHYHVDADDEEATLREAEIIADSQDLGRDVDSVNKLLDEVSLAEADVIRQGTTTIAQLEVRSKTLSASDSGVEPAHAQDVQKHQTALNALHAAVLLKLKERKQRLQQALATQKFVVDAQDELAWIADREPTASSTEVGSDLTSARSYQQKQAAFETEVNGHEPRVQHVLQNGTALLGKDTAQDPEIQARLSNLETQWKHLKELTAKRTKDLDDAVRAEQYHADANETETWLFEYESLLTSSDVGKDVESTEALLKKHDADEAVVAAYEKSIQALRAQCDSLTQDDHPGKDIVSDRQGAIDEQYAGLKDAAKNRRQLLEDALKLHQFEREADDLERFIQSKEDVAQSENIPQDLEHIEAFQRKLDKLEQDLAAGGSRLDRFNDLGTALVTAQHPEQEKVTARQQELNDRYNKLRDQVRENQEKLSGARSVDQFGRDVDETKTWIAAKDAALATQDLGTDISSVQELQRRHEALERDLDALGNKIKALNEHGDALAADGTRSPEQIALVHERQAELNSAWDALQQKAKERAERLAQALSLQEFIARARDILSFMSGLAAVIASEELAKDLARAEMMIAKHQERKGKMNANVETVKQLDELGHSLIARDHYAKDEISSYLERIATEQAKLQESWTAWSFKLTQCRDLYLFNRDADQIDDWISGEETLLIRQRGSIIDSLESVRILIRRNDELCRAIAAEEDTIARLDAHANRLVGENHYEAQGIAARRDAVIARFNALKEHVAQFSADLEQFLRVQQAVKDLADARQWVDDKLKNTSSLDLPAPVDGVVPDADINDRLKRLEVFQAEIDANRDRVARVRQAADELAGSKLPGSEVLGTESQALAEEFAKLCDAANNKGQLIKDAAQSQLFTKAVKDLEVWLDEARVTLQSDNTGKDVSSAAALLEEVARVERETRAREGAVHEMQQLAKALIEKNVSDADAIRARSEELTKRYEELTPLAASRRAALENSAQLHRFTRSVEDELSWIGEKDVAASSAEYGKNQTAAQSLQKKHIAFEAELVAHQPRVDQLAATAAQLASDNPDSANTLKEKMDDVNGKWAALKQKSVDRGNKLNETVDFLRFNANIDEEEFWIKDRQTLLQSTEHGDSLPATAALLRKHDEFSSDLSVHQDHLKAILATGEKLLQQGHYQSTAIASRMEGVENAFAVLEDLSHKRRARLDDTLKFHQFNNAADAVLAWIKAHEYHSVSTDYGKDLPSVIVLEKRHQAFNVTLSVYLDRFADLRKYKDELVAAGHKDSAAIQERYTAVSQQWDTFTTGVNARTEKLALEHQRHATLDEFLLMFAKKAGVFYNWLENAEEDLSDPVRVNSINEIQNLQSEYLRYQSSLGNVQQDFTSLAALNVQLSSQRVPHNPYTPLTMKTITDKWDAFLNLIEVRLNLLDSEAARQDANEDLRKQFAEKANALGATLIEIRTAMVESTGALDDQLKKIEAQHGQLSSVNASLKHIEALSAQLEKERIFNNPYTDHTSVSLAQQIDQLDQLANRMKYNVKQQIEARNKKGVSEEQIREFETTFNHFDRNKNGYLDYTELRSCLMALGYDLPLPKEGESDPEFDKILSIVDADRDGKVAKEEYIQFMISRETTNADNLSDILDAFKKTAGDKPFVTKRQLVEALGEKTANYCVRHMKPYGGDAEKFDYKAFAEQLFTQSSEQKAREEAAKVQAKLEQELDEKEEKERDEFRRQKELQAAESQANRRTRRKLRDDKREAQRAERAQEDEARKARAEAATKAAQAKEEEQRLLLETRAREEKERHLREEAERKAREEQERRERQEREEQERLALLEAEKRAREQREEQERREREEIERKAREEAERKAKEEAERKAKEETEKQAKEEAERKAREEAERQAREEAEKKSKEEAERRAKEEADKKAKEEQERKAREEQERRIAEEQEKAAKAEAERKAKEELDRLAREEEERKARLVEAEKKAAEEAAARKTAEEEAERRAEQLETERRAKEEADRKASEDAATATSSSSSSSSSSTPSTPDKKGDKKAAKEAEKKAKHEREEAEKKAKHEREEAEKKAKAEKKEAEKKAKEEKKAAKKGEQPAAVTASAASAASTSSTSTTLAPPVVVTDSSSTASHGSSEDVSKSDAEASTTTTPAPLPTTATGEVDLEKTDEEQVRAAALAVVNDGDKKGKRKSLTMGLFKSKKDEGSSSTAAEESPSKEDKKKDKKKK